MLHHLVMLICCLNTVYYRLRVSPSSVCITYGPPPHGLFSMLCCLYQLSNTLCPDGKGVMCWQQCYYGDDLPPCGLEAECVDPVTGELK